MKRTYKKPKMKVVILQYQQHLLGMSGEISGYKQSSGGFSQDEGSSSVKGQSSLSVWDEDWSK